MLAPIFTWDLQRTMQQRWFHAARIMLAVIVLALFLWHLIQVTTFFAHPDFRRLLPTFLGEMREHQHWLMVTHFALIFLIAPILAAGPLLNEKKHRTLELLLTTQQRSINIIISYWLSAVAKLMVLTSPTIPLLIWMHAFGEASPITWMVLWIGATWLLALPLTAWPMLVAVYARQWFSALLFGYAGNMLLLVLLSMNLRDAQIALWSYAEYDAAFWSTFTLIVAVPTIVCLCLAIWRLRPTYTSVPERAALRSANRPTLAVSDQPILWKQTHCSRDFLPGFVRWLPHWARLFAFIVITVAVASLPDRSGIWSMLEGFGAPIAFSLAAIVLGGSSISAERDLGTWDSLRLTLVNASEIFNDTLTPLVGGLRKYWLALLPAVIVSIGKQSEVLSVWELCIVAIAGTVLWICTGALVYHAAVAGFAAAATSQSSLGGLIHALTTFLGYTLLVGALSAFGAGGIGLAGCFFACMAASGGSDILSILLFAADLLLIGVLFFKFAHVMLRNRTELLRTETIENLVKHSGFQR